ncbi:helix-turn-helix transcriptional regulator [Streptococcus agalactiae]|uniref:Helix-turn-helix transcriptional regulator n=1 Tax=Helcococcus bovis TaxID=3153252 RepID=A0ABW9F762_9FIRM|nr:MULTISPECIES: helix-turn-helix transcriptional regulator [Streptococcus]NQK84084.1 helix-turn-helix transcriptional regulator [Streptococcus suis]HEQ7722708.1 helix-turn-helix transcriptional regulator [Streptococcus pyogenes]KAF1268438.1 transcriptional regulator [Streptococcus agalactiae]RRA52008.1 XRE family transcriptional regulator [Streptococcus agalactiae]HEM2695189.1 helix-turn-helix transcriptional regulator [Streptococcus suis]
MDIGKKIKQIRKSMFLTQEEFAEKLNVSFCTVNRWENNKAIPNLNALKKIKHFCEENEIEFKISMKDLEVL